MLSYILRCPLPVFSNENGRSATWLCRYICYVKSLVQKGFRVTTRVSRSRLTDPGRCIRKRIPTVGLVSCA